MHKQIKDLFTDPIYTMSEGLWFSGYKDDIKIEDYLK